MPITVHKVYKLTKYTIVSNAFVLKHNICSPKMLFILC